MAYCHPLYDDFFVEPCDDRGRSFRGSARLEEQQRKREIQFEIAEELSQLASDEYRDDILMHMEKMEVRQAISHQIPNLRLRFGRLTHSLT